MLKLNIIICFLFQHTPDDENQNTEINSCIESVCKAECEMDGINTGSCIPSLDTRAEILPSSAKVGKRCQCKRSKQLFYM